MNARASNPGDVATEMRLLWYVWLLAWLCTSLMGGCFGALLWLLQGGGFRIAAAGFWMGFYLVTLVGAFIVPTFGLLARVLKLRGRKSLRMMTIAGGATGLVSGFVVWPLLQC